MKQKKWTLVPPDVYQGLLEQEYMWRNVFKSGVYSMDDIKRIFRRLKIKATKVRSTENMTPSKTSSPFIPTGFQEYIGQEKAKLIIQNYIRATTERKAVFPHCLIHGKAGFGKTTLANIIIRALGKEGEIVVASSVEDNLMDMLINLENKILFIDEIHSLARSQVEQLYQAMESFSLNGQSIPPFTLIGATTELGEIIKDRKPFYDRFKIILELEDYTQGELTKIGTQFQEHSFPQEPLTSEIMEQIAINSRLTPRAVIRLTEATVYFKGDLATVLQNFNILYNGYTDKDLLILQYLSKTNVVGLQGIASYLDTSVDNYLYEIEPYLIKTELIIRTPRGRAISDKGRKLVPLLVKRKASWNDTQKNLSTSSGTLLPKNTTKSTKRNSNN